MKITELFDRGEFVVTAEVGPPKGIIWTIWWKKPRNI